MIEELQLVRLPNEPTAVLEGGGVRIEMGATFMHALSGLLYTLQKDLNGTPYQRDCAELLPAVREMANNLVASGRKQTDDEAAICMQRFHDYGRGYWSSWMNESSPWRNYHEHDPPRLPPCISCSVGGFGAEGARDP